MKSPRSIVKSEQSKYMPQEVDYCAYPKDFEEAINLDLPKTFGSVVRLPIGSVALGNFLGKGAFGQVYRGEWNNRPVAMKEINIALAQEKLTLNEEEVIEALEWEISRLSTVSHPNIVQFYGLYEENQKIFLIMEFCEGGNLDTVLRKNLPNIPWSIRWQWALEISKGLAYLHHQGVLHRDLKTENVLLDKHQRALLADLGVAQVDALLQMNEAEIITKGFQDQKFISPEGLRSGGKSTFAGDIYALGLVFWQLTTGKLPRKPKNIDLANWHIGRSEGHEREPIPSDCPEEFKKLILDCWDLDLDKRPRAEHLVERLSCMASQFHANAHLVATCEQIEELIHHQRLEILKYKDPYLTEYELTESVDSFWTNKENQPDGQPQLLNLKTVFEDFLKKPDPSTLLLLGEGGLGKTLSTYHRASQLMDEWWKYLAKPAGIDNLMPYLPVPIRSTLTEWTYQKLSNALKEFSDCYPAIKKEGIPLLVIIDGYDECQTIGNYENLAKHLGITAFPKANKIKLLVTCRVNAVEKAALQSSFHFKGNLQVYYFLPFKVRQLLDYLKDNLFWDESTYQDFKQTLSTHTELRTILRNPFVLSLLAQSWNTISKKNFKQFNRFQIYEVFIEHWISTQQYLLSKKVFKDLIPNGSDLIESFKDFASNVAFTNFRREEVSQTLSSLWLNLEELIKKYAEEEFDDREKNLDTRNQHRFLLDKNNFTGIMLIRLQQFNLNSPLKNRAKQYEFSHRSFFEYFIAKKILQMSKLSFEKAVETGLFLLNNRAIQEEPETLVFIREGKPTQGLKDVFFEIIERSKQCDSVSQSSANAITILNAIKVSFFGRDFKGIKISGADLTGAILDNTDLTGANLSGVILQQVWMQNANLSSSNMEGTIFGELAYKKHDGTVKSCCYSPDGKYFASVGGKNIKFYVVGAVGDLTEIQSLTIEEEINACSFSNDNKYLAVSAGGNIILYSREEKREEGKAILVKHVKTITGHTGSVYSVTFSFDNKWLASAGQDNTVRLWSLSKLNEISTKTEHTDYVLSVTFSHDNKWLASGGRDKTVKLWSLTDPNNNQTLPGCNDVVYSLAFSYDNQWLASGCNYNIVKLWSLTDHNNVRTLSEHTGYVLNVSFSHDNLWLASGGRDYTIRLWRLDNLNNSQSLTGHTNYVNSVTFSYDNLWLASGSDDNTIRLWSLASTKFNGNQTLTGHTNWVLSVTFSRDNKWLASGSDDNTVRLWSLTAPDPNVNLIFTRHDLLSVYSVAFSYDNQLLAFGSRNATVRIWNLTDHSGRTLTGHTSWVLSVAFSYDNKWLASGCGDKTVKLWSLTNPNEIHTIIGHTGPVRSIAYSRNNQWLASGSDDKTVRLWSLTDHNNVLTLTGHTDYVLSVAFSYNHRWLVSGGVDKKVLLWGLSNPPSNSNNQKILTGHTDYVRSVTFSYNNKWLASGSSKEIIFWNVESLSNPCIYPENFIIEVNFNLRSLAYSSTCIRDHLILAAGGGDHSVRLFEQLPENKLVLLWTSTQTSLCARLTDITNASISATNADLLTQHGAINRRNKPRMG